MSIVVPDDVLSEITQACKINAVTLVESSLERPTPIISIQYEIEKGGRWAWWTHEPMVKIQFDTTVTLATPPWTTATTAPATKLAIDTSTDLKNSAIGASKAGTFNMSRGNAVKRAEKAVSRLSSQIDSSIPGNAVSRSWLPPDWIKHGRTVGDVTQLEAATALAVSLAHAWHTADQRVFAENMLRTLSPQTDANSMPLLRSWMATLSLVPIGTHLRESDSTTHKHGFVDMPSELPGKETGTASSTTQAELEG